jgi:hypothetical protein
MGTLAYIILRRSCLVNEQNAMVNLKNDMVKTSRYWTIKKNSIDFGLEKVRSLQLGTHIVHIKS